MIYAQKEIIIGPMVVRWHTKSGTPTSQITHMNTKTAFKCVSVTGPGTMRAVESVFLFFVKRNIELSAIPNLLKGANTSLI